MEMLEIRRKIWIVILDICGKLNFGEEKCPEDKRMTHTDHTKREGLQTQPTANKVQDEQIQISLPRDDKAIEVKKQMIPNSAEPLQNQVHVKMELSHELINCQLSKDLKAPPKRKDLPQT